MLKKVLSVCLIGIMSLGITTSVFAEEIIKSNTVDATINSGGFDLQTSPINSFGDITIKLDDQKYSTGFEKDFIVRDLRGLDDNWQLTVSSTPLVSKTNPNHVFKNVLSISPLQSIDREGNTVYNAVPSKVLNKETVLDDGDVLIAKSDNGSGLGQFSLAFPSNALHLMVTPGMKEGFYEPVITWNLLSVPTN